MLLPGGQGSVKGYPGARGATYPKRKDLHEGSLDTGLGYAFCVARNITSKTVPETFRVAVYGDEVMKLPDIPEGWKELARVFKDRCHLPRAIGAVDGKHIRIKNSPHLLDVEICNCAIRYDFEN